MKKLLKFLICCAIFLVFPVYAANPYCTGLKSGFRIIGEVVFIVKILVPIVVIGLAAVDFIKVIPLKEDIGKPLKRILMRIILGILVFFIPSFLDFGLSLVDSWSNYALDYNDCVKCILNVKECR